ncbi:MAG: Phosphoribosylformylglycinamidine cyclo-ligase [Lentisphaerae bacterium ADurb.BinA184]|nr:MAG: Phosphoribosylformylglycinamidine cyclo-ligase [Lentisphaerae bacterium ADurb.BinA184]
MARLTYRAAGVDYDVLDGFKRMCQKAAAATSGHLRRHGMAEPAAIRGESAYVMETDDGYLAHVEEALGTKILVADAMYRLTGTADGYRAVAIDDVATIANDLCACGALPVCIAMYAAVGDNDYFADSARGQALADGFAEGCRLSGAAWSGGETQTLKGMVVPGACILGGSALGRIAPKSNRIAGNVQDGDAIILLASSGVQTNGLTLCRALADRMPEGYLTRLGDGRSYGEALLDASVIYVSFVAACQEAGIPLHYAAHMTGHGWRKLMRLDEPFVYRIERVPPPQPVFALIQAAAQLDTKEMYATFNMGVGFAVFVAPDDAGRALDCAHQAGYQALHGGWVRREGGRKAVEIAPLGIEYGGDTLHIR